MDMLFQQAAQAGLVDKTVVVHGAACPPRGRRGFGGHPGLRRSRLGLAWSPMTEGSW